MEHSYQNAISTTRLAATIGAIAGFEAPATSDPAVEWLAELWIRKFGGKADRVLIFSADAVPAWMVRKYTDKFATVWEHTPLMVPMRTALPTITPFDYAAFFSGTAPGIKGEYHHLTIEEMIRPLPNGDSMIAAAVRAGWKVAVVTCANGCIASMLSKSGADLFIIPGDDDEAMYQKAEEIVLEGQHDFVFLYQLSFDYAQHAHGPESEMALYTLDAIIHRFDKLCHEVKKHWDGNTLLMFHTDHGCHLEEADKGSHGKDIPEDTDIFHFWGGLHNA